jgi:major membrane immunogen (membrane-anchored lipoprotein)
MKRIVVFLVAALVLTACGETAGSTSSGPTFSQLRATETASAPAVRPTRTPVPKPVKRIVVYRTIRSTGSGGTGVTYNNAQGGVEQRTFGNRTWERKITVEDGFFAYISAQNRYSSGSITCQIVVDGEVWRESKSSGGYTIATCSGTIGRE